MKRRLTRRALSVIGVGCLLVLVGTTAQAGWLFVLAAGVFGMGGASMLTRPRLSKVDVARSVPSRARVGDDVRLGLTVHNGGRRSLPLMRVEDRFGAFDRSAFLSERLQPGATTEIEIVRSSLHRGRFSGGEVELKSGAPFGLVNSTRVLDVASETIVVPRWVDLSSFPILEPSSVHTDQLHERARTGAGQEFMGVREYRPGDPRRFVHWKTTARAGKLVVREYEEHSASRVALVLAGADTGDPPDSAFERLVEATATIAMYALTTGHPVELIRAESDGRAESLREPGRLDILDWLAAARPIDAELIPLVAEALRRIGRRGTVVILTPSTGRAGADLASAVGAVQAAGCRAIAVVARSNSWSTEASRVPIDEGVAAQLDRRVPVRHLVQGEDLQRCLQGSSRL